ncbi:hypothetical protein A2U01_0073223, partial [Trifolium medium]|nr:hypothetical protein [Trifolium medium]
NAFPNEGQYEVELTASQPTTEPLYQPIGHAVAMGRNSQVTSLTYFVML